MIHSLALLLALAPPADQPLRVPPVDTCAADASFTQFRAELRDAITRKDRERILAALADDIAVDFGGGAGRADFIAAWKLDRPEASPLWQELGATLDLGCTTDRGALVAPSYFAQLPVTADPFETLVAVVPGSFLLAEPDDQAATVAPLDWHVLTLLGDSEDGWVRASLTDGRSGYVRSERVRSAVAYRAHFERRDGRWRMTSFVAGD